MRGFVSVRSMELCVEERVWYCCWNENAVMVVVVVAVVGDDGDDGDGDEGFVRIISVPA